jgi:YggT family protein
MDIARTFVFYFCQLLTFIIVARAILSWIAPNPYEQPMRFLYEVTEPILAPLRRIIPHIGMMDITPVIAIIILQLVANLVRAVG